MPDEYKEHHKHLYTRFGIVFYDDKIVTPQALRRTVITLLHKGHPAINNMSAAAKLFWRPKLTKEIQAENDECIPCKMAGKSIKPQILMSEINYLQPTKESNREILLDFIGPIRFEQRQFFILISIYHYSGRPTACICKASTGKTATFLKQYLFLLNGIPQTIGKDKRTAFLGKEFRTVCRHLNIKLIYGTPCIHTATGLIERRNKTRKDLMKTNLADNCNLNEALYRSLTVLRKTVHSKIKKTPFERHYGKQHRNV